MRREVLGESIDSPPTNEEYAEALQSAIDKLTSHPLSDPSFEPLENSVYYERIECRESNKPRW